MIITEGTDDGGLNHRMVLDEYGENVLEQQQQVEPDYANLKPPFLVMSRQ